MPDESFEPEGAREAGPVAEPKTRALIDLAKSLNVGSGKLSEALHEITEAAARALEVDRASVWLYSDDRRQIRCIDLYLLREGVHASDVVLLADDYPDYFKALELDRTIPADDAHTDWRTREFSGGYLKPLGINSMLDAPIRVAGEMIGVVCHEHVGPARQWSVEEQRFAGSIADFTALAVQANALARSEEALRIAQVELERRIEQLQSEIAARKEIEIELQRARVAAEDASRAKSAFLANLSHELRTPLNSIIGFSEIVKEKVDPSLAGKVEAIETSGRSLLEMIEELLEMASLEAGLTRLDEQRFDLGAILTELSATVAATAERKGNRMELKSLPSVPMFGDPVKLWRLLWNLIENANKFTHGGIITVEVDRLFEDGRERVRVSIRDSGIGIAPEHQKTIFEPFVQGDSTLRRRYGGAGLGLAIARRLCDLMQGEIALESKPGQGSTFIVTLPVDGRNTG